MARDFNGSTGFLRLVSGTLPITGYPCSMSAWFFPIAPASILLDGIFLTQNDGDASDFIRILVEGNTVADRGKARAAVRQAGSATNVEDLRTKYNY